MNAEVDVLNATLDQLADDISGLSTPLQAIPSGIQALKDSKADTNGSYPSMTAGAALDVVGGTPTTDTTPYLFRRSFMGGLEKPTLIGGTVAWNQLAVFSTASSTINGVTFQASNGKDITVTGTASSEALYSPCKVSVVAGHKYYLGGGLSSSLRTVVTQVVLWDGSRQDTGRGIIVSCKASGTTYTGVVISNGTVCNGETLTPQLIDLTSLFGSATIADYIYDLEQANAGAGVAWFKQYFSKDYYPYDAGNLISVKPTAHVMRDADENIIGNYSLGSDELRGIPQLTDGKLSYNGDVKTADGQIVRKYGIVDLGTLTWSYGTIFASGGISSLVKKPAGSVVANIVCSKYTAYSRNTLADKGICIQSDGQICINDSSYTDAATFRTAMSGVYLVAELAAPTIEQGTAFAAEMIVDPDGTEEFVDDRTVPVPVGNETNYFNHIAATLTNSTDWPSKPLIRVYGTGSFAINDTTVTISTNPDYIDIDCDMQDCYYGAESRNQYVSFSGNDFPELQPGENYITMSGVTKLEITPRWWEL